MNVLIDLKNAVSGIFVGRFKKIDIHQDRGERRKAILKKRRKQLIDSYNSVGDGYHKQHGWIE